MATRKEAYFFPPAAAAGRNGEGEGDDDEGAMGDDPYLLSGGGNRVGSSAGGGGEENGYGYDDDLGGFRAAAAAAAARPARGGETATGRLFLRGGGGSPFNDDGGEGYRYDGEHEEYGDNYGDNYGEMVPLTPRLIGIGNGESDGGGGGFGGIGGAYSASHASSSKEASRASVSTSASASAASTASSVSSRNHGRSTYLGFFLRSPVPPPPLRHHQQQRQVEAGGGAMSSSRATATGAAGSSDERRTATATSSSNAAAGTAAQARSGRRPAALNSLSSSSSYYQYRSDRRRRAAQQEEEEEEVGSPQDGEEVGSEEGRHRRRTPKSRGGGGGGGGGGAGTERDASARRRSPSSLSVALQEDDDDEEEEDRGRSRQQQHQQEEEEDARLPAAAQSSSGSAAAASPGGDSAYLVAPYWRHAFGTEYEDDDVDDRGEGDVQGGSGPELLGRRVNDDGGDEGESDGFYEDDDDDDDGGGEAYGSSPGHRWLGNHPLHATGRDQELEQEILFSQSFGTEAVSSAAATPRSRLSVSTATSSSSASSGLAGEDLEVVMGDGGGGGSKASCVIVYSPPSTTAMEAAAARTRSDDDSTTAAAAYFDPYPSSLLGRVVEAVRNGCASALSRRGRRGVPSLFFVPTQTSASQLPHLIEIHRRQLELHHFATCAKHPDDNNNNNSNPSLQEHWDFCLVLQPQQVYGYWAQLLDFRSEFSTGDEAGGGGSGGGGRRGGSASAGRTPNEGEDDDDGTEAKSQRSASLRSSTPSAGLSGSLAEEGFEMTVRTPLTGLRRRNASSASGPASAGLRTSASANRTAHGMATSPDELFSVSSRISNPATRSSARKSVFERALMSPNNGSTGSTTGGAGSYWPYSNVSTPALTTIQSSMARRRWGASSAPHSRSFRNNNRQSSLSSPPIRSISRGNSATKPHPTPSSTERRGTGVAARPARPANPNVLRMEDIPQQRMARGVAARTHGLVDFLAALKRGVVVRLHSPSHGAMLVKLESSDGGDTIRYTAVVTGDTSGRNSEALRCLAEQRMRYHTSKYQSQGVEVAKWSLEAPGEAEASERAGENDENSRSFSNAPSATSKKDAFVPDYVAAQRLQQQERRVRFGAVLAAGAATARRQLFRGTISAADIAVVHPAAFSDPRCPGELATSTFRRSRSGFNPTLSFSLVLRNDHHRPVALLSHPRHKNRPNNAASATIDEYETKWLQGQGSDSMFKYVDIETATLGEYWLLFRGFLLLHRDVAVGRFAAHRAAGIGSHYSRIELELARGRNANRTDVDGSDPLVRLHENEFHEPATAGCWERLLVNLRGIDPTYLHGYVLETAKEAPPSDYFLGFTSPGTAIWSRLRQAGLETSRVYSLDPNRVMIKVRCPTYRLLDVAEVLKLKIRTQDGSYVAFSMDMMDLYPPGFLRSSLRQSIIDFIIGSRIRDSGAELARNTSLGKLIQARVPLHMTDHLQTLYSSWFYFWRRDNWSHGHDGRSTATAPFASNRLASSSLQKAGDECDDAKDLEATATDASGSSDAGSDTGGKRGYDGTIPNAFKRVVLGSFYQPLDSIEEYFGEKVAFYFAWLQHTASHLIFLSVAGLIVFAFQVASGEWDHWIRPFFSLVVMLWTFVVLINWKKRANFLAHRWGTMNYKEQETTRPQFQGDYVQDDITGEWVITYPRWKRWVKYTISFPLTLLVTFGSLFLIFWVHGNRDAQLVSYMARKYNTTNATDSFTFRPSLSNVGKVAPTQTVMTQELLLDPTFWFITVGMPSILGLFLPLVNLILMHVSVVLNDFENYKTESEYRTYLIIKVFSFRFVCYFATLYYYSFVSVKEGTEEALEAGMFRVASGVLVFTTVTQWWQNFLSVGFPIAVRSIRMRHRQNRLCDELYELSMEEEEIRHLVDIAGRVMDDSLEKRHTQALNKRLLLEQAQDPMWLEVMLPLHDSFPEYIQAVVQFTYVACFSVALPITPLIVLFNYLVGMRLDAYKICKGRRRPLAEKTGGIGIWEHLLHIVSVIGVLTNCWLVGFTSSLFRSIGDSVTQVGLFAIVVGWEHVMLLIKYVMQTSISPLPLSVANSIRREQHELEQQRSSSMRLRRLKHQREEEAYQQQQLHEVASKARHESPGGSETPTSALAKPGILMSC